MNKNLKLQLRQRLQEECPKIFYHNLKMKILPVKRVAIMTVMQMTIVSNRTNSLNILKSFISHIRMFKFKFSNSAIRIGVKIFTSSEYTNANCSAMIGQFLLQDWEYHGSVTGIWSQKRNLSLECPVPQMVTSRFHSLQ